MFYFQGCWLLGKPSRSIYFSLVRSVKLNPTPNIPAFSEDWKIFSHRKNNAYILLNGYFEKGKVGVFVQSQRRVWMDHMNIENDYFMPNFINSVLINSHLFIATWSKVFFLNELISSAYVLSIQQILLIYITLEKSVIKSVQISSFFFTKKTI